MKLPFEKKYFKNLDALRGIAALMVVFCHFSIDFHYDHSKLFDFIETIADFNGSGGTLAVRFFFILSGFLITFLLFEEKSATNHVNIKNFFARRIFRIWPLYFLILIIGFFIYPEISKVFSGSHTENASLLYYSLFLANLDQIYHHNTPSGILSILWSLSVEEQFYIIWPFLIYFMSNKKRSLFWFLILIVLFAATFIYANSSRYEVQRIHTISSFLELGCLFSF
jgi:peptidoglycan/LPS O-acetylase OafA/YrhL